MIDLEYEPGDLIAILVDGSPIETVIDELGTQRFLRNSVIDWLFKSGQLDLNRLWVDFYVTPECEITRQGLIELYQALGYSVCGFQEVWGFGSSYHSNTGDYVEILNPVWKKENLDDA